jgi:hypothetical protein
MKLFVAIACFYPMKVFQQHLSLVALFSFLAATIFAKCAAVSSKLIARAAANQASGANARATHQDGRAEGLIRWPGAN